jgi:serine/threonine protein kinase
VEGVQLADRYRLTSLLGHGGMGDVWLACDQRLQRDVAVKVLRPQLAADLRVRRRFEDEARAAAQLAHPNVVAVFDSGEDEDGTPFLVMERLSGRTLADVIRTGPMPIERVEQLADQMLSALAAAHGAGVLHRDVKPANVLLAADGTVKVGDFGIAKIADDLDATTTGVVLGTPAYLAPERMAGHAATPAADIFAVGVVLYEALTGTCPFEGDHPLAVAAAMQRGEHVPVRQRRSEAPASLAHTIERAMSVDPDARFPSAAAMRAALLPPAPAVEAIVSTVAAGPPPTVSTTVAMPVDAVREVAQAAARPPARHRMNVALGWIALVAVLLVIGAGLLLSRSGGNASPTGATVTTAPPTTAAPVSVTVLPPALDSALSDLESAVRP